MEFKTGKHAGMTTELVLLKKPDFAQWYLSKHPYAKHSKDFARLIKEFDAKPFISKCRCGETAVHATAYEGAESVMFWCDNCNPYSTGATSGSLQTVDAFGEALGPIDLTLGRSRHAKRAIVRALARAKGLPKRVGELQASAFFATPKQGVSITSIWED